ncbi:serine hydrolase domain-containing protein [Nocardia uniformis]|nr:serine hydrolase domain-containing protein [Nocardia uniformis]
MTKTTAPTAIQDVLDRAVSEGGVPGIIAEVRDEGRQWFGTAGVADTATEQPRLPQHRFRIGSITKTFVATVLLKLVGEGLLGLDDTVHQWLPNMVRGNGNDGDAITVRQLLNHTSGLFNYTDDREALNHYETHSPSVLVNIAVAHPPTFAPGTNWGYSNTNYILAGLVVEAVAGASLHDELRRHLIEPLGLTVTSLPHGSDPAIEGPHSRHYTKLFDSSTDAVIHDATELDVSMFGAAGGMISTLGDLHRFFAALLGGQLLHPAEQAEMLRTVPTENWIANTGYGLGISSVTLPSGVALWGMGGALFGSWTYAYGTGDGHHVLVANVNGEWAHGVWCDPIGVLTDLLRAEFD